MKAHDDEMTFVLLARDASAPVAIGFWIADRIKRGKNKPDDPLIVEAEECARTMEEQRAKMIGLVTTRGRDDDRSNTSGCED